VNDPVLSVTNLSVRTRRSNGPILEDVNLTVAGGERVGLVGESGSGKSTLGYACLGFTRPGLRLTGGGVRVRGMELDRALPRQLRALRKDVVGYIPQSAGFALDPSRRIGAQLEERLSGTPLADTSEERICTVLDEVRLPTNKNFRKRYPHELSGGQQQRVVIASAFLTDPRLVILDEPTTGLDVSTQSRILAMVRDICEAHDAAALFISHDLGSVAELCSRIFVMYAGRVVEEGLTSHLLTDPRHPYTAGLIQSVPDIKGMHAVRGISGRASLDAHLRGCKFAQRCYLVQPKCTEREPALEYDETGRASRCFYSELVRSTSTVQRLAISRRGNGKANALEVLGLSARYGGAEVVTGVSFSIPTGTCVGLVGESGSGKSTVCRAIVGLHHTYRGEIVHRGARLARRARDRPRSDRREIQYVFQNPYDALNPRRTVRAALNQPRQALADVRISPRQTVDELLQAVSLESRIALNYPGQLSGGERQRVAIARALAVDPSVLICDEITSALDVSVQASIVELLRDLQQRMGLTLLFVTHDLALVRHIADSVVVLKDGVVVESGLTPEVFAHPKSAYTETLLADSTDLWDKIDSWSN
jgi:peptide/nickel transport system ATP-binding protein